jgi:hypothetical protein
MQENVTNQSVILPTQKVIKKKYIKPEFEVINLEDTPKLLAASGPNTTNGSYGTHFNYGTENI